MTTEKQTPESIRVLWEEIGTYSVQCAKTGELAPSKSLIDAIDAVEAALASAPPQADHPVEELRRAVAAIGVVGQIDGHDVIRRLSVLDIVDRRRVPQ